MNNKDFIKVIEIAVSLLDKGETDRAKGVLNILLTSELNEQ